MSPQTSKISPRRKNIRPRTSNFVPESPDTPHPHQGRVRGDKGEGVGNKSETGYRTRYCIFHYPMQVSSTFLDGSWRLFSGHNVLAIRLIGYDRFSMRDHTGVRGADHKSATDGKRMRYREDTKFTMYFDSGQLPSMR